MGLFGFLEKPVSGAAVVIDVSSGSVGGAYVSNVKGKPTLNYSTRVGIRPHDGEELAAAMLRALTELADLLVSQGAPVERRVSGNAHVREVLVSVSAPWQESSVRTERVEKKEPFTITRSLVADAISRSATLKDGRVSTGETVLATVLNGYETSEPFGRKAKLVDFVVLSSSLPKAVRDGIEGILSQAYHSRHIRFTAYAPSVLSVFRDIYPHEKHYLIFDVASGATEIAFVHQGLLSSIVSMPLGVGDLVRPHSPRPDAASDTTHGVHVHKNSGSSEAARSEWMKQIANSLKTLSSVYALPRTLFLVADTDAREYLRRALDDAALRQLWLSEEPLTIIPVTPAQFTSFVGVGPEAEADVGLMMLALFHGKSVDATLA